MAKRENTFLLKRSNVPGKIPLPGDLNLGEIALNTADVILYASGTTSNSILPIGWDRINRTGDTVTGNFIFNGGLTANTISAATYQNLPIDVFVTGGTYNNGTTTFRNNTGGTFNVTGFTSGGISGDYLPLSGGTVTGATSFTSGLTANTFYTNYIDFNTTASTTTQFGRVNWDNGTGTLNIGIGDSTTGLIDFQVGQEEVVRIHNGEATTLQKGEIVYVSGSQGNRPKVKRAQAQGDLYSVTTLGMVDIPISSGSEGYVTTFGIISNLNTLGLTGGTPIWLSPTTPGAYTSTKPKAPDHTVLIGYVVRVSATVGSVFINISNGWELDEIHDVRISGATNGDLLIRSSYSGTPVWVNSKTLNGSYTITGGISASTMTLTTTSGVNQINSNTSTDAFKITQLGSGNTFVVQDSTNPDLSPFVIDNSGNVAIGKTSVTSGTLVDLEVGGKTIGINIGNSNTSFMAGTGIFSYGTGIGINGVGRNDYGTVVGIKGESTFDSSADPSTTYYGGEFISSGLGGKDYSVRLSDGTEGIGKFLYSVDANGSANWTSDLSGTSATISGKTKTTTFQMTSGATNGYVLTSDANGNGTWAAASGGLTYFTEARSTAAPNATVPVDSLTALGSTTNVDVAIIPKGTGAILAQVPDSTATSGNKRGANAIDLQRLRTAATQVASGTGSATLGYANTASSTYGIAIGSTSIASGTQGIALGFTAVASGNESAAMIGGTSSNQYALAVGNAAIASGQGAIAMGPNTTASATGSLALNRFTTANGTYSSAFGNATSVFGIQSRFVLGNFNTITGDCQKSIFTLSVRTTNTTTTTLTVGGTAASTSNQVILASNSCYRFKGTVIGKRSGTSDVAAWDIDGLIVRGANAAATTLVVSNVNLVSNIPAWGTPTLAADTTNGGLRVQVTGAASTNIQWTAVIETTEVIYA